MARLTCCAKPCSSSWKGRGGGAGRRRCAACGRESEALVVGAAGGARLGVAGAAGCGGAAVTARVGTVGMAVFVAEFCGVVDDGAAGVSEAMESPGAAGDVLLAGAVPGFVDRERVEVGGGGAGACGRAVVAAGLAPPAGCGEDVPARSRASADSAVFTAAEGELSWREESSWTASAARSARVWRRGSCSSSALAARAEDSWCAKEEPPRSGGVPKEPPRSGGVPKSRGFSVGVVEPGIHGDPWVPRGSTPRARRRSSKSAASFGSSLMNSSMIFVRVRSAMPSR